MTTTATIEITSVTLTLAAMWGAIEFGLKFPITQKILYFLIRHSVKLTINFSITRKMWYFLAQNISKLIEDEPASERDIEISTDEMTKIRYARSLHGGQNTRSRGSGEGLEERSFTTVSANIENRSKPKNGTVQQPLKRSKWLWWRKTDTDEEHGRAGRG